MRFVHCLSNQMASLVLRQTRADAKSQRCESSPGKNRASNKKFSGGAYLAAGSLEAVCTDKRYFHRFALTQSRGAREHAAFGLFAVRVKSHVPGLYGHADSGSDVEGEGTS